MDETNTDNDTFTNDVDALDNANQTPYKNSLLLNDVASFDLFDVEDTSKNGKTNELQDENDEVHLDKKALDKAKRKEIINVVMLGIFFLLTGNFLAIQNIQSTLNSKDGLGVVSIAVTYGAFIFSGLFSPVFVEYFGNKMTLIIGGSGHTIYAACNFYPTWWTLVPGSIIAGGVTGPLWTAQGAYMTHIARRYAKLTSETLHAVLSRFHGIFFGIFLCVQISGNLITSLVLFGDSPGVRNSTITQQTCGPNHCPHLRATTSPQINHYSISTFQNSTYTNQTLSISQLNSTFLHLNTTSTTPTWTPRPPDYILYTLFAVFVALDVIGVILAVVFMEKVPVEKLKTSVTSSMLSCVRLNFSDLRMPLLVPFVISHTFVLTILYADFSKAYISCTVGISMVGYVMAFSGFVSVVLAVVFGRLAKHTGRIPQIAFVEVIYLAMITTLYTWTPASDDLYAFFIIAAIWGLGFPIMMIQGISLIALVFGDRQAAGFANFHSWRCVGFTLAFATNNVMCVSTKLIVAIVMHVIGTCAYACVELLIWRRSKDLKSEPKSDIKLQPEQPLNSIES